MAPVFVGDVVNFYTETRRIGRTSVTVGVTVEVERWGAGHGERVTVTEAEVVLVAVGTDGRPIPIVPAPAAEARMIAAFAPGTVSNVAAGFDVLGFALDEPGDVVVAALADGPGAVIAELHGDGGRLSRDPAATLPARRPTRCWRRSAPARACRWSCTRGCRWPAASAAAAPAPWPPWSP